MTAKKRVGQLMPLDQFPADMRERVEFLAAQSTPPPRWLRLGHAEIPSRAWTEWHLRRGINPYGRRQKIDPITRAQIVARDKGICQLCGDPVGVDLHIDHRVPVSRGGGNEPGNLQVAHAACNLRKGNQIYGVAG